ncbi:MAG: hypothetical protein WB764_23515 [Xanthobacteraceae bacterium]
MKARKKATARGTKKGGMSVTVQHPQASSRKVKLPKSLVKVARDNKLHVNVERLNTQLLKDQRARMMASDGCISNPGGPGC